MEVVMKKGFIAALSLLMCLLLLPVNAYVENDLLGEVKRPFDLQAGYELYEWIDLDAIKEPEYNDSLMLEVNQLIEGEDSGASAKVYMLIDTCMRIFIEVTDSELIDPTQEQQVEEVTGGQTFDSIQLIFDSYNGDHSVGKWFQDNPEDDDGSWPWNLDQSWFRVYRMDHTGFVYNEWMDDNHQFDKEWLDEQKAKDEEWELLIGKNAIWSEEDDCYMYFESGFEWNANEKYYYLPDTPNEPLDPSTGTPIPMDANDAKYFTNNDFIGWGNPLSDALKPLENDENSFAAVRKTDKGYNIEIFAMWPEYGGGTEMGLNIVLTDVYDGGEKKSVYTLNGEADPMDWKTFDYIVIDDFVAMALDDNGEALDAAGREAYINAQLGEDAPEPTDTEAANTANDTDGTTPVTTSGTDNEDGGSGNTGMVIGIVAAVVVVAAVIVVVVVMKKKKTE